MLKVKIVALVSPDLEKVLMEKSMRKQDEFESVVGHYVQVGIECERQHKEKIPQWQRKTKGKKR